MEQIRVVKEMRAADMARGRAGVDVRPRWMCWENVPGAFSSGNPKYEDFRIVLEEIMKVCIPEARMPGPNPGEGWPDAGMLLKEEYAFSLAWRCLDAQLWGLAQRRKRIFLLADFASLYAPLILFDALDELEDKGDEEQKCISATITDS